MEDHVRIPVTLTDGRKQAQLEDVSQLTVRALKDSALALGLRKDSCELSVGGRVLQEHSGFLRNLGVRRGATITVTRKHRLAPLIVNRSFSSPDHTLESFSEPQTAQSSPCKSADPCLKLRVRTSFGHDFDVHQLVAHNLEALRAEIAHRCNVPVAHVRLFVRGRELPASATLEEGKISDGTVVQAVLRSKSAEVAWGALRWKSHCPPSSDSIFDEFLEGLSSDTSLAFAMRRCQAAQGNADRYNSRCAYRRYTRASGS